MKLDLNPVLTCLIGKYWRRRLGNSVVGWAQKSQPKKAARLPSRSHAGSRSIDTVPALQSLAKRFRLGIISNVDDDLFAETRKKLAAVEFDFVVTAQQMQSYKPVSQEF